MSHRLRLPIIMIVSAAVLALLAGVLPAWARPGGAPQRQTVPMTPPPTWTPVHPATPRPSPTRPEPPVVITAEPDDEPTAAPTAEPPSGPTGIPTALPLLPTPSPGPVMVTPSPTLAPTPTAVIIREPRPYPWMGLSSEITVVGPGSQVRLSLELRNLGTATLPAATIQLVPPKELRLGSALVTTGALKQDPTAVVWEPGALAPGARQYLDVLAIVAPDVLPDGSISLRASLEYPGTLVYSNDATFLLPPALLPATGG